MLKSGSSISDDVDDISDREENYSNYKKNSIRSTIEQCCCSFGYFDEFFDKQTTNNSKPNDVESVAIKVLNNWTKRAEILGFTNSTILQLQTQLLINEKNNDIIFVDKLESSNVANLCVIDEMLKLKNRKFNHENELQVSLGYWLISKLYTYENVCNELYLQVLLPICNLKPFFKILFGLTFFYLYMVRSKADIQILIECSIKVLSNSIEKESANTYTKYANLLKDLGTGSVRAQIPPLNVYYSIYQELRCFTMNVQRKVSSIKIAVQDYLELIKKIKRNAYLLLIINDYVIGIVTNEGKTFTIFETGYILPENVKTSKSADSVYINNHKLTGLFDTEAYRDPSFVYCNENQLLKVLDCFVQPIIKLFERTVIYLYMMHSSQTKNKKIKMLVTKKSDIENDDVLTTVTKIVNTGL